MRIEFLFLEGCINSPPVWNALRQALKELGWSTPVEICSDPRFPPSISLRAAAIPRAFPTHRLL
jgi:hypothetical protein